jgi:transcriptional regulator with XRE-family HTH domain
MEKKEILESLRVDLTDEQLARDEEVRKHYAGVSSEEQLMESGEFEDPVPMAQGWALIRLVAGLKAKRIEKGISITRLGEMTGLTRAGISRLENNHISNPTLDTLFRYSLAVGALIDLRLQPLEELSSAAPASQVSSAPVPLTPEQEETDRLRRSMIRFRQHNGW